MTKERKAELAEIGRKHEARLAAEAERTAELQETVEGRKQLAVEHLTRELTVAGWNIDSAKKEFSTRMPYTIHAFQEAASELSRDYERMSASEGHRMDGIEVADTAARVLRNLIANSYAVDLMKAAMNISALESKRNDLKAAIALVQAL